MSEAINDVPQGWAEAALEELVIEPGSDIVDGPFGSNMKAAEYVECGVPIIRLQNIDRNHFIEKNLRFISSEKAQRLRRHSFKAGDTVVSKLGDPLGEACIVPDSLPEGIIVADIVRVRLPDHLLNRLSVTYSLNSYGVERQFKELTKGTTRPRVNLSHVRKIRIPLPPLSEQRRIVAEVEKQFTRLEAAIAALKRVKTNLKRYRASVLKAACEGRLVPTEAELACAENRPYEPADQLLARILKERRAKWEADQLAKMQAAGKSPKDDKWKAKYKEPEPPDTSNPPPEGWVWATPDQLSALEPNSITDGPFGSNLKTEHYTLEGPRVIRLQNVGDGVFLDEEAHISGDRFARLTKHRVEAGDVVIAALGVKPPRACVIPESVGPAIVKADCIRLKVEPAVATAKYVNCALNAEPTKARTSAIVHGVGRPRLNLGEIKAIVLPLPPVAEQHRIVTEVERRLSVIDEVETAVEADLKRAERLRQSILKRAFEGKLVSQDPNDEPASVLLERIRAARGPAPKGAKGRAALKSSPRQLTIDPR